MLFPNKYAGAWSNGDDGALTRLRRRFNSFRTHAAMGKLFMLLRLIGILVSIVLMYVRIKLEQVKQWLLQ